MKTDHSATIILAGIVTLLVLFLASKFNLAIPLTVTTNTKAADFSVIGEGKMDVVPDTMYIDTGISVQAASTTDEAQQKINDVNNKIIEALKGLGVQKESITTSNYSVNPNMTWDKDGQKQNGYNGNISVTIKLHDPKLASQVIDTVTKVGANQVRGTRFVVDDMQKYREQVRQKAIDNAKEQAEKLAKSLGISLGKITNISESTPGNAIPMMARSMALGSAEAGAAPQIEPGSQTITSTVTLYFERK